MKENNGIMAAAAKIINNGVAHESISARIEEMAKA